MEEDTHSFIIRIWDTGGDPVSSSEENWRGSIDYVGSGKRLYFNDLNSIAAFIHEQIRSNDMQAVARWEAIVERTRVGRRVRSFWRQLTLRWLKFLRRKDQSMPRQGNSQ